MGTFDLHFGARQGAPQLKSALDQADGLRRRNTELAAQNAQLKHQLRAVRDELATLRACLAGGKP